MDNIPGAPEYLGQEKPEIQSWSRQLASFLYNAFIRIKNGLVPYEGADKAVDLGSQNITTTGTGTISTVAVGSAYTLPTADGNNTDVMQTDGAGAVSWQALGAAGESNTASNAGSGTSVYYQKAAVDLQFNAIKSENNKLGVVLDGATHDIELTVNEANIDHDALTNFVANEHIDWTSTASSLVTTGDGTFDEVTITNPSQNYKISGADNAITIEGLSAATAAIVEILNADKDNTDATRLYIYSMGDKDAANYERMSVTKGAAGNCTLLSQAGGTGTVRDIVIDSGTADTHINSDCVINAELQGSRTTLGMGEEGTYTADRYLDYYNGQQSSASNGYCMSRAGSIVGASVSVLCTNYVALDVIYLFVKINGGTVFSVPVAVSGVNTENEYDTQARGTDTFVAGDVIALYISGMNGANTLSDTCATVDIVLDT